MSHPMVGPGAAAGGRYRCPSSAVITAEGDPDTPVWVDVLTIEGMDIAVTEDVRASPIEFDWASSPYVLLVISVRDETSWTLEIDGGAR